MRIVISAGVAAILGFGFSFAIVAVAAFLGIGENLPSPGGEDDFSVRITYFLQIVCPAFTLIGAWIGYVFAFDKQAAVFMCIGATLNTLAFLFLMKIFSHLEKTITSGSTANRLVLIEFVCMASVAALGAWTAQFIYRRRNARSAS